MQARSTSVSPVHAVQVSLPDAGDESYVELVELDHGDGIWGGSRTGHPDAYGTAAEVMAALSGRPDDDAWIVEVATALARERDWGHPGGWRRPLLDVIPGRGEMFHATAAVNRESIARHGLDWRRMGAAPGIAGSTQPELPAVFVCDTLFDVGFFVRMARSPTDVWSVRVDGLWVETGPDGWWIINQPIVPERLRLVARDVSELGDDPRP